MVDMSQTVRFAAKTTLLVLLAFGVSAGCSVKSAGLVAARAGAGGATVTVDESDTGTADPGRAEGDDALTTAVLDAHAADFPPGAGGAGGSLGGRDLGAPGLDGSVAVGGQAGSGGAKGGALGTGGGALGTGGASEVPGGALATGGQPDTGGVTGAGGGTGGATGTDAADSLGEEETGADAADAPSGPEVAEPGPEAGPEASPDRADDPIPDVASDVRDARDARDGRRDVAPPLTLVWSDEFDGAANTGISPSKWNYVTWPPRTVNNEEQRYTSSLANVFHDGDGHLVLRALFTPNAQSPYTSGRIDTSGRVAFGPGHRIEVRAKLPAGKGSFPGIVMMGTDGDWPQCGQLSLMEQYGQDKRIVYSTVNAGSASGSGSTERTPYDFLDATAASADFHVYSVDWYSDRADFQVDGDEVLRSSFAATSPLATIAEYIILDVALGGTMGGTIDNGAFTTDKMDLVVDYVRVYEL
jgi:beta-glucanase (GH16 family)